MVTVEALASVLEPQLIASTLEETGKQSERRRKLPADLVVWLLVGMALFRDLSISNVLSRLAHGLGVCLPWTEDPAACPTPKAIRSARDRLGFESLRSLFRRFADHLRRKHADQNLWHGHAVYAIDGTTFTTPDTDDNERHFGRPGSARGRAGYPKFRGAFLMTLWSHIVVGAAFAPYWVGELRLARFLLEGLEEGAILLGDRLYFSYAFLADVGKKAHFLVRVKTGSRALTMRRVKRIASGEWLAVIPKPKGLPSYLPAKTTVRLIRYQRKGYRPAFLVTDLIDPVAYSSEELTLLYHGRWEVELCFDEVKTHFVNRRVIFRSGRHERVLQEAYGLLVAYLCVRALMARAARARGVEPRDMSFTDSLVRIRDAVLIMAVSAGRGLPMLFSSLLADLARCVLPPRRSERVYPRAVKVKMSNFPLKRCRKGA